MKVTMTKHVVNDRMERMMYIARNIGWVKSSWKKAKDTRCALTSTGVVLIKPLYEERLVTAHVANMNDVTWLYRSIGCTHVPSFASKVKKLWAILSKMINTFRRKLHSIFDV